MHVLANSSIKSFFKVSSKKKSNQDLTRIMWCSTTPVGNIFYFFFSSVKEEKKLFEKSLHAFWTDPVPYLSVHGVVFLLLHQSAVVFFLSFMPKSLLPLLFFSCSKHSGWLVNCAVGSKGRDRYSFVFLVAGSLLPCIFLKWFARFKLEINPRPVGSCSQTNHHQTDAFLCFHPLIKSAASG